MSFAVPALKRLSPAFRAQYGLQSRILLRAILRECTYLPDSLARHHIAKQAISRFRTRESKSKKALNVALDNGQKSEVRSGALRELHTLQKKASIALRLLQRANDGELKPLLRVLYHAYGRVGKRRHELLAPLLQPDQPDQAGVETTASTAEEPMKWDLSTVQIPDIFRPPTNLNGEHIKYGISKRYGQLKALIEFQANSPSMPNAALTKLRVPGFVMPARNSWARPMPRKRVKNFARKQKLKVLSRTLPPLPEEDWRHLQALINSEHSWEGPQRRRKRIAPKPDILTSFDVESLLNLKDSGGPDEFLKTIAREARFPGDCIDSIIENAPTQRHLKPSDSWLFQPDQIDAAMLQILEDNVRLCRLSKHNSPPANRGHKIGYRLMRRLWITVFRQCPRLQKTDDTNSWVATWSSLPVPEHVPEPGAFAALFNYSATPQA